jgi:hypothetical protein
LAIMAYFVFILAVAQFVVPKLPELTGMGQSIEVMAAVTGFNSEAPTAFSFAIWVLIFLLALVFAVAQLLPGIRQNILVKSMRVSLVGLLGANCSWMVLAQLVGNGWWLVCLIALMWVFALLNLLRLQEHDEALAEPLHRWVTQPMLGLYSGWLSVALWLNASSLVRQLVPDLWGLTGSEFALLVLATVVAFASTVLLQLNGNRWFAGAVLWALLGVVWHNLFDQFHGYVAIFASVSVVWVAALVGVTPVSRLFRYVRRRSRIRQVVSQRLGRYSQTA